MGTSGLGENVWICMVMILNKCLTDIGHKNSMILAMQTFMHWNIVGLLQVFENNENLSTINTDFHIILKTKSWNLSSSHEQGNDFNYLKIRWIKLTSWTHSDKSQPTSQQS